MVLGNQLRKYRQKSKFTATEIAQKLGVSKSTISNYEKGIRKPSVDTIRKLAILYGVSIEALVDDNENFNGITAVDTIARIPIYGTIFAESDLFSEENILDYMDLGREYIGKGEFFALYIIGDSMNNSRIYDGDIVIVRKQDSVPNGSIAVVLVDNEAVCVKKVFKKENTITLMPSSNNPVYQPRNINTDIVPVKILGQVVETRVKL